MSYTFKKPDPNSRTFAVSGSIPYERNYNKEKIDKYLHEIDRYYTVWTTYLREYMRHFKDCVGMGTTKFEGEIYVILNFKVGSIKQPVDAMVRLVMKLLKKYDKIGDVEQCHIRYKVELAEKPKFKGVRIYLYRQKPNYWDNYKDVDFEIYTEEEKEITSEINRTNPLTFLEYTSLSWSLQLKEKTYDPIESK